jgi:predicted amidohydrolase
LDANLAKIIEAAERAADEGSRLLLLPECCMTGGDWPTGARKPAVENIALSLGSAAVDEVARTARRLGIIIAVGFYEQLKGRLYVSQALLGPGGLVGVYRKVHEGRRSSADRDLFPVFDVGFARVGISICRDNAMPECSRILALKGAEILLAPFMSLPLSRAAWRLQRLLPLRARAQDNRLFMVSASHAQPHVPGKPPEWGYSGICCAIDPLGEVIGESRGRVGHPQSLTVTLDARVCRTYLLADVPSLRERRPAAYRTLTDQRSQNSYLKTAPPFRYNDKSDRITVRGRAK